MSYTTLIASAELAPHLNDPDWAIVDARFSLTETEAGRQAYQASHIPGAVYAHLDEDLSGPIIPGQTSRHPLPEVKAFAATLGRWGIDNQTQVVVYDSMNGIVAARLWWMLRWVGHTAVAVLDGGWPQWEAEGHLTRPGSETRSPRVFTPQPHPALVVDVETAAAVGQAADGLLVDCRAQPRYAGETEPLDPVAGHIPGAINAPVTDNLAEDGRFLPPDQLRRRFTELLGGLSPEQATFYCGSGVSAAHNLLAMAHIGLEGSRLYAGSWSEWITDPARPIATGQA